jgi:putative peptide zinc metalloprotease protein
LDGKRSVGEILEAARATLGAEAPDVDETVRFFSQLYNADILQADTPPGLVELTERQARMRRLALNQKLRSPLAIRVRLIDPSRFLAATRIVGRLLFSRVGFAIWIVLVGYAALQAAAHWGELTGNLADRVLAADNVILMLAAFILAKLVHELGHGYAVARWGGEVHEMGVLFLVFAPIPYVDASSATSFASKWQRVSVGAAGMYVELLLAALALFLWLLLEPGLLRSAAFNLVFIASITTLFFNANPLLRFDGYFILCDLIESPNLGPRSNRFVIFLLQRYFLGVSDAAPPEVARGEAPWLVVYALASTAYRLFIMAVIALFLAQQYLFLGVALALWIAASAIILPLARTVRFLAVSPVLQHQRGRAVATIAGALALLGVLLFVVPVPLAIRTEGIVWPPSTAEIAAQTGGFVAAVHFKDGDQGCAGCPLIELEDPELPAKIAMLEARQRALLARYQAEYGESLVKAQLTQKEIQHVEEQIAVEQDRMRKLQVLVPNAGEIVMATPEDMMGRFVRRGSVLAYSARQEELIVRAIVRQDDVGLTLRRSARVKVRLSSATDTDLSGRIDRAVPSATDRLPNMALSSAGGGTVSVAPQERKEARALEKFFEFHIAIIDNRDRLRMGQRAHVQLIHGDEPIAMQWWRRLRQLFLRQLSV